MLIRYIAKLDDMAALISHLFTIPGKRKRFLSLFVFLSATAGFMAGQFFDRSPGFAPEITIINVLLAIGFALLFLPLFKFLIIWVVKRKQPEKSLGGTVLQLDTEGIRRYGSSGAKLYPWREVTRFTSDGNRYYIHLLENRFVVIPRDALQDENEFVDLIERHARTWKYETESQSHRGLIIRAVALLLASFLLWSYYTLLPSYKMDSAVRKTNNLFEKSETAGEGDLTIKKSTDQTAINQATKALHKIDTSSRRYEKFRVNVLLTSLELTAAQRQLYDREGKVAPIPAMPEEEVEPEQMEKQVTVKPEDSPIISLLRNFPELEKEWHDVPSGLKQYVMVPSLNSLPFSYMKAEIVMEYKDMVGINFISKDSTVRTLFWKPEIAEEKNKTDRDVQLKNNIVGFINEDEKKLYFHDPVPDSRIQYGVWIEDEGSLDEATAIKIANSMIEEGKVNESDFSPYITD